MESVDLIPGGSKVPVTKENIIRYIHLVAHRRLNIDTSLQNRAFLKGFQQMINPNWVRLFSPYELQKVISGDDEIQGFDVKGLKLSMAYGGGYHPSQPYIIWFWDIVEQMTPSERSKLLKFMTSCSRQPLLGFKSLSPLPCVYQVRLSEEELNSDQNHQRLPSASTCMNLLKLPNYKTKEIMRSKLLYAIESGAGFELS
jgi:ubiquitin-protein ligase E3 C